MSDITSQQNGHGSIRQDKLSSRTEVHLPQLALASLTRGDLIRLSA